MSNMDDKAIFETLFEEAKKSKDPKGVVATCLAVNGSIIATAVSSDDGIDHAENVMLSAMANAPEGSVLYCTLEPCSKRNNSGMIDCVTDIIRVGIREVVYGASDPKQSETTKKRLDEAGVILRQVNNSEIIRQCAIIFNDSVSEENKWLVDLKPIK